MGRQPNLVSYGYRNRGLRRAYISTIKHQHQRYPTVGDWQLGNVRDDGEFVAEPETGRTAFVMVSDLGDWRYNMLVGVHELIEAILCKEAGVSAEDVDDFDMTYERARADRDSTGDIEDGNPHHLRLEQVYNCTCPITDDSEPGDDIHAPYHLQHKAATLHETMLAKSLNVDWDEYNEAVEQLP